MACSCCGSFAALTIEAGGLETSTVGAAAAVADSAAEEDTSAAEAVEALAGADANVLGVTEVETLPSPADASGVVAIVEPGGCVAAISADERRTSLRLTYRAVATTTTAITETARHRRATPHRRLRLGLSTCTGIVGASGEVLSDASSADFTALANRSSISSLGATLGLSCGCMAYILVYAAQTESNFLDCRAYQVQPRIQALSRS